jgi:hypothetical protein
MLGYIIITVFVLIIVLIIYIEYKNEKKYQEERDQKHQNRIKEKRKTLKKSAKAPKQTRVQKNLKTVKPELKQAEPESISEAPVKEKKPEPEQIQKPEILIKIDLPTGNYPKFNHSRLLKMGLSEDEAKEFVKELIPQIGTQIPLIKEAMEIPDFHRMERLTHSIKGSSTTVGTGGVSDLLVDYNTYLKTGTELVISEAYFNHLNYYYEELKKQYSE